MIGTKKCQGFIRLHNFSGADWGGKFVGITKKSCADAYMALDEDDSAIYCFQNLGTAIFPTQLTHGKLLPQIENLESFVCHFFANHDYVTLQSCDGKCLGLGTWKEKAYCQHAQPLFPIKLPSTTPY